MKSLEELKKLRDLSRSKIEMRNSTDKKYRVVVGMATCGIAAGARPVLNALVEESAKGIYSCTVTQTGCIGMCSLEPIVEVYDETGAKTTYVKVDAATTDFGMKTGAAVRLATDSAGLRFIAEMDEEGLLLNFVLLSHLTYARSVVVTLD